MYIHTDSSCITVDRPVIGHARPMYGQATASAQTLLAFKGSSFLGGTQVKISKKRGNLYKVPARDSNLT